MTQPLVMAIDQGTSSSRAIVFDRQSRIVSMAQEPFQQYYPQDGWVEHDPEDIWQSCLRVSRQALQQAEAAGDAEVVALGITNQRETTLVWDTRNLAPIYRAIVWQDRRTADQCRVLHDSIDADYVHSKTGLLLDPYFSASKIAWILDNVAGARDNIQNLAFGTVDCFLLSRLSKGRSHATDATNASRSNLFNIHSQDWDEELLTLFNIPASILPEVKDCAAHFGVADTEWFGREIPVLGMAGDQHAALIGQCGFNAGDIKSTYGTGCFMLSNTGDQCVTSKNTLLSTVAYRLNGTTTYALEGSIFNAGTTIQWLRDELEFFDDITQIEAIASGLASNQGVYLVPAFTGLGAPYWNPEARGIIAGLTRDTHKNHIIRAGLESVCYQSYDLLQAMQDDGVPVANLKIDGGMVKNNWLAQYLADIIQIPVQRPAVMETTALGAAYLASLQAGLYSGLDDIQNNWQLDSRYQPHMSVAEQESYVQAWHQAVRRVLL